MNFFFFGLNGIESATIPWLIIYYCYRFPPWCKLFPFQNVMRCIFFFCVTHCRWALSMFCRSFLRLQCPDVMSFNTSLVITLERCIRNSLLCLYPISSFHHLIGLLEHCLSSLFWLEPILTPVSQPFHFLLFSFTLLWATIVIRIFRHFQWLIGPFFSTVGNQTVHLYVTIGQCATSSFDQNLVLLSLWVLWLH